VAGRSCVCLFGGGAPRRSAKREYLLQKQILAAARAAELAPQESARQAKKAPVAAMLRRRPELRKVDLGNVNNAIPHCEEPLRRSNPEGPRAVAPGLLRCARNDDGVDAAIIGHRLKMYPTMNIPEADAFCADYTMYYSDYLQSRASACCFCGRRPRGSGNFPTRNALKTNNPWK
jgi:hypothetical protein